MAKEPAERYRSARELHVDLEAALRPAAGIATARHFAVARGAAAGASDLGLASRPTPPPRVMIASRSNERRSEPPPTPPSAPTTARSAASDPTKLASRASAPELATGLATTANPWKIVSLLLTVALAGLLLARLLGRG